MQSNTNGGEDPLYSSMTDATAVEQQSFLSVLQVCDPATQILPPRQSQKLKAFYASLDIPRSKSVAAAGEQYERT